MRLARKRFGGPRENHSVLSQSGLGFAAGVCVCVREKVPLAFRDPDANEAGDGEAS